MGNTLTLVEGYDRSRYPKAHTYRPMTIAEIRALKAGDHVWFVDQRGKARQCKINGAVRTWKTDPDRVEVPVKYGLWEFARLSAAEALRVLVVPVEGVEV